MFAFHHVAISTADAGKSVQFYEKLGFTRVFDWSSSDGDLRIIHMKLGGAVLEIFNYSNTQDAPATARSLETDLPRIGVKHFGLRVPDIEAARRNVVELGLAVDPAIKQGRTGITYFFINDPDGNWVEFVQDDRGL